MATESKAGGRRHIPYRYKYPGYFRCKRKIKRLRLFQNLLRHEAKYPDELHLAPPIVELLPEITDQQNYHVALKRKIYQLIPLVYLDLEMTGIRLFVFTTEEEVIYNSEGKLINQDVKKSYNLIADYFQLPRSGQTFDMVMAALEQGISVYEERLKVARWELFNPLVLIGKILHWPVFILERSGVEPEDSSSTMLKIYEWVIRGVFLLILVLLATKLGISIPWEHLFSSLVK